MRVNITYSVELEEILKVSKDLISQDREQSFVHAEKDFELLFQYLEKDESNKALQTINEIRKKLAKMDMRLSDCTNLISGYQKTILDSAHPIEITGEESA